jgi:hypothetical protein
MFGTSRTSAESLLDVGEGVVAILVASVLFYLGTKVARYLKAIIVGWWEERSVRAANIAAKKISIEISALVQLTRDSGAYQAVLSKYGVQCIFNIIMSVMFLIIAISLRGVFVKVQSPIVKIMYFYFPFLMLGASLYTWNYCISSI